MCTRRESENDVSAVELAAGDQVEGSDEEADPAGDEHRVAGGQFEGRRGRMQGVQDGVEQLEGERFSEPDKRAWSLIGRRLAEIAGA